MQYRDFGRLAWRASVLGFGCMRLPRVGAAVDETEAIRMIRRAVEGGVNYVDTAYGYHGGRSEVALGSALRDGYRAKVKVATKMPHWHVSGAKDFDEAVAKICHR